MTMVPAAAAAQNPSEQNYYLSDGYGGGGGCYGSYSDINGLMSRRRLQLQGGHDSSSSSPSSFYYYYYTADQEEEASCLLGGSDLVVMAEDESRTNSNTNEETGSTSKDIVHHQHQDQDQEDRDHDHQGWLQLGLGGQMSTSHHQKIDDDDHHHHHQVDDDVLDTTTTRGRSGGLVELDLLNQQRQVVRPLLASPMTSFGHVVVPEFRVPPRPPIPNYSTSTSISTSSSSLFLQQQQHHQQGPSYTFPHHQEINWAFRPLPPPQYATTTTAVAASSLVPQLMGSYFARPYQLHATTTTGVDHHVAGPSSDMRVINAPRRPHSGIWFMLQASQNQAKEPYLPQISKSYLRIKDGRMTVRLLMKYLVNKLRLDSESEIEITCRGQQLQAFLTLQHVRDNIWSRGTSPRDAPAFTLLPDSSTTDHVMVLRYGRTPS